MTPGSLVRHGGGGEKNLTFSSAGRVLTNTTVERRLTLFLMRGGASESTLEVFRVQLVQYLTLARFDIGLIGILIHSVEHSVEFQHSVENQSVLSFKLFA